MADKYFPTGQKSNLPQLNLSGGVLGLNIERLMGAIGGVGAAAQKIYANPNQPEFVSEGAPVSSAKQTAKITGPKYTGPNFLQTIAATAKGKTMPKPTGPVLAKKEPTTKAAAPTGSGATGGMGSGAASGGFTADMLYQDPTSAYQPVLAYLNDQADATRNRYAQNAANISSIFGALSGLSAKDTATINKQFTDSIAAQQMNLAARTVEQRAATKAGETQAVATGAERGEGPAMTTNPIATAAEEGISRSNTYQTTWENLQKVMQNQAVIDTQNRQAGYGQQEVGALQQLQQNLEDQLLKIGGDKAAVRSDIAKAKLDAKQTVLNTKYSEAQDAKAAAAANARAANKPKTYSRDIAGWSSQLDDTFGAGASNGVMGSVSGAIEAIKAAKKTAGAGNPSLKGKSVKVSKAEVIAKLTKDNPTDPAISAAIEYVNKYSGLSS